MPQVSKRSKLQLSIRPDWQDLREGQDLRKGAAILRAAAHPKKSYPAPGPKPDKQAIPPRKRESLRPALFRSRRNAEIPLKRLDSVDPNQNLITACRAPEQAPKEAV
jgi:hypothetical protein